MEKLQSSLLLDARIKLLRAYDHIVALRDFAQSYAGAANYQVRRDYSPVLDRTNIRVAIDPLPGNMAAMAGDAAANLFHCCQALWNGLARRASLEEAVTAPPGSSAVHIRGLLASIGLLSRFPELEELFCKEPQAPLLDWLSCLEAIHRERLLHLEPGGVTMLAAEWKGVADSVFTEDMSVQAREGKVLVFPPIKGERSPLSPPQIRFELYFGEMRGVPAQPAIPLLVTLAQTISAVLEKCDERLARLGSEPARQ